MMSIFRDALVKMTAQTQAFDLACDSVTISLEDLKTAMDSLKLQPYQAQIAQTFMVSTAGQPSGFYDAWRSGLRVSEITMELKMASTDPFDPFKVEAGCAHPDDYREPLPYHGEAPSADEWLCSGCGYWKKGSAFGVTALPQPEPLSDKDLDELLEKQAKTSVSDFRDQWLGGFIDPGQIVYTGADLSITDSVAASFPIPYPRLPMPNAQVSYNSIKALMHELEDRNRQKAHILYSPDITVNAAASAIIELRLMMQYNDKTTPVKSVTDGLFTLDEIANRFVRSHEQHFEAHPKTIHDLAREFLSPASPLVSPTLGQLPWKMLGRDLIEQRLFNPGMIALALT